MQAGSTTSRKPLYVQVADQVRDLVSANGLQPGDRLPTERDLAEQMGVSRSTVRQALASLRAIGFVRVRQGDGVYLEMAPLADDATMPWASIAKQAVPQIIEVREALETHTARLAARRRSRDDVQDIAQAVTDMAAAIEAGDDPSPADMRFHTAIASAADNPMLEGLMRQLAEPIGWTRAASLSRPGRPAQSLEDHRRILAAIEARSEDDASAAMREHLSHVAAVAYGAPIASPPTSPTT